MKTRALVWLLLAGGVRALPRSNLRGLRDDADAALEFAGVADEIKKGDGALEEIDGRSLVTGSPFEDVAAGTVGRRRLTNGWPQLSKLTASDPASGDVFGHSVALAGDILAVGAYGDDGNKGAVYVFESSGSSWPSTATKRLTASDGAALDFFGISVALADDLLAVGAPGKGSSTGAVYVFERSGSSSSWPSTATKRLDGEADDYFGGSLALANGVLAVGAYGDDDAPDCVTLSDPSQCSSGSVYVFDLSGPSSSWADTQTKLTASDGAAGDQFGISVALAGGVLAVGAEGDDDRGTDSGSVYVYDFSSAPASWPSTHTKKLFAGDDAVGENFGQSVALADGVLAVGAGGGGKNPSSGVYYDGSLKGAVYVFDLSGDSSSWPDTETQKLTASDGAAKDEFGSSVALSGDLLAVGALRDDSSKGSIYVFERSGASDSWPSKETKKLIASNGAASALFGKSVALSGDIIAVGAEGEDSYRGAVYVYEVCQPGSYSEADTPCKPCEAGTYADAIGATTCKLCGDGGAAWQLGNWDQTQSGLTNSDQCKCIDGRTGTNCDQEECAPTTPVVSLGFLVLEGQWPRFVRELSRNEDFVGISAAFRSYDIDGNNRLSVAEARRAIRAGGMAVPLELSHIWSRDGVELDEGDVTITEMIEDELARLQDQGTKEYYEQPEGSGEITAMEATYPNPLTNNTECENQTEAPPKLTWTVDRDDKVIYQQCVFFNGEALTGTDEGLNKDISDGGDCKGEDGQSECSYNFQLPGSYEVKSYQDGVEEVLPISKHSYCVETNFCPVENGCALNLPGPIAASQNNQVATVDSLQNYELTFTMELADDWSITGEYQSILHIGGTNGQRLPGLWFHPSGGLHVVQSNKYCDACCCQWGVGQTAGAFEKDKTYEIKVVVAKTNLTVYVDDVDVGTASGDATYTATGAAVYVGSPWYDAAKVTLSNICLKPIGCNETVDPNLTIMRCTTGLQYDGTPMDVYARMRGPLGISISWLYTSPTATIYRVYKFDPAVAFATDTSARLLREVVLSTADCGLTFSPDTFRDTTTGSEPGISVGYAVVPVDPLADGEEKAKAGVSSFVVTWFGDVYVEVAAEGGGPVKDVLVKLSHLVDGKVDDKYRDFVEVLTDEYGEAQLQIRVQDPTWAGLTQHFRVTVEKNSTRANGRQQIHNFEPSSEDVTLRHLGQFTFEFTDTTSRVISGTVSHDGFNSSYFAADCPHLKSEDSGECMCPVDGAQVYIKRASGGEEEVVLNNGKFAHAVLEGETVTIGLRMYNGTNGDVPHSFSITHDAGDNATTANGQEPAITFMADEDTEVHFLDTSTQTLAATYVVGADRIAEYVNGIPVVAKVERCGWERWDWALRGVAMFELGAAAVEVRALGDDEVLEAKYYYPPGLVEEVVPNCNDTERNDMVFGDSLGSGERLIRGCRAEIPKFPGTEAPRGPDCTAGGPCRLPCATMDYEFVDQLPEERNFEVDLSVIGTGSNVATNATNASSPVEFLIVSPLCLKEVTANGTTLQSLLTHDGARESEYDLASHEELLLSPPADFTPPEGTDLYGEACTDNTNAVFRERDAVGFEFVLVEREPQCYQGGLYPWGVKSGLCNDYVDTPPSPEHPIAIRVYDGVSRTESSATYSVEPFEHTMTAGPPNPFAPFSHELSVEFTRAFDGAEILFVRHALVVGVIPEEVPQVWTVATNPTLIFFVLRDPPGGGSFASLTEGSTISTSMAIDGSHAAELEDSWQFGASVGGGLKTEGGVGIGAFVIKNIASVGAKGGFSYSQTPTDVTVSRSTSRHFDVGISFSAGISTSSSPYLAGQPSDVIVGGGANLRFISSVEVYATASGDKLCLRGRNTKQFLPEQISTWVMSVYEIEKTVERLGAALADPNGTKLENAADDLPDPRENLEKQIQNWQTVLSNYRAATIRDQAESVADQLSRELKGIETKFQNFLVKNGNDAQFAGYLSRGLDKLGEKKFLYHRDTQEMPDDVKEKASEEDVENSVDAEEAAGGRLGLYEKDVLDRVNDAFNECVKTVEFAEPGTNNKARLCDVYKEIRQKIELKESALFGICDFAKDCCKDESEVCTCRDKSNKCDNSAPKCAPVDHFCKRDHYESDNSESKEVGAFGALFDTTQFITFSGTTGLEFSWDIAESRGAELTSTHDATVADSIGGSFGFGANFGRRRLESADDGSVPGYAYPISGRVLARSKKLLEVTPDALEERRRRRRLDVIFEPMEFSDFLTTEQLVGGEEAEEGASKGEAETEPESTGNPCSRRLDGIKSYGEEGRRLGVTACADFKGGTSSSFAVSLGRAASKDAEHSRSVSIFLGDGNAQDVFAVKISQDAIYGTPIFTTMGGRSSCVGETGTTRRDSRVTIKEIKPLCVSQEDIDRSDSDGEALCKSMQTCECKDLAPGEDAIFSVVLENLSPWVTGVRYLLRAAIGASTAWDSGKYARVNKETCSDGDAGSLAIGALASGETDLRIPDGYLMSPLAYGQSEVRISVSRPDSALQCSTYENIELELVAVCEATDWDSNQEVYQYNVTMDEETGDVTVIHPKWDNVTYSFTDDTKARGPETSTATFDVSWAPAPQPAPQPESCELGTCAEALFAKRGCTYEVASNYKADATFDDGSCVFSANKPVLIAGSFCIAGVNATDASSIQDMLQVLVGVVTGLTSGASFTFDLSTAPSCSPDDTTRRRLEDSASAVNAVYTVEVQSQKTEEIDGAVVILNDKTELNRELRQLSATATIVTAIASVPSQAPSFAPTSMPTLTRPPTLEMTPQPTPGPKPDPTPGPTLGPTLSPTVPAGEPTAAPITEETGEPTLQPTLSPTPRAGEPTAAPMPSPTTGPEPAPTPGPKPKPTLSPTLHPGEPTAAPLPAPTTGPEPAPTLGPKPKPTPGPTVRPGEPTAAPVPAPTTGPEPAPTPGPKPKPTLSPTVRPGEPTAAPLPAPTTGPEPAPTLGPEPKPSPGPTVRPTGPTPTATRSTKMPTPEPTIRTLAPTLGGCPALGVPDECPKDATGLPSCDARNLAPGGLCVGNAATCPDMPVSTCPASFVGDRRRLDDGGLFVFKIHGTLMPSSTTSTAAPPTYSYSYTMAPTMAPTTDTMSPTATLSPTRTETYAPTRTTEAPSYAPTTETYAPTSTPTATGAPTAQ